MRPPPPSPRFLQSQILCRLYKSPSDETINTQSGLPCVYAYRKIGYARYLSYSSCQSLLDYGNTRNNPARTESVRFFRILKWALHGKRRRTSELLQVSAWTGHNGQPTQSKQHVTVREPHRTHPLSSSLSYCPADYRELISFCPNAIADRNNRPEDAVTGATF